jgi:putative RecB family exonuclease
MEAQYECIKEFPGIGAKPGDIIEIEKLSDGSYIIAGGCHTDANVVYEFFQKKRLKGWLYSPYSHSKMETWKQCQKKFEYSYIIRPLTEVVASPILEKGTLFHSILEHDVTDNIENFSLKDVFKALTATDAEEIIDKSLIFAQTSTMYNKIKKTKGIKVSEQEMFLDKNLSPTEDGTEALIRGFIDLIIFDKDNSKCYVYDWKTGGGSKDKLIKWPKPKDQLELYAIWAVELFDVDLVETGFVYVEQDHLARYVFKREDIPALKKKFKEKIDQIEKDKSFKKNLTKLCGWCDYRELCLGISIDRDPYTITLELIKACA